MTDTIETTQATTPPPPGGRRAMPYPGLAGAAAAALAVGLTELFTGLFSNVPSALASIGSYVVDWSPHFVTELAITLFGTSDKGALAVGIAVTAILLGVVVGRLSVRHRLVGPSAFFGFGLLGFVASAGRPSRSLPLTFVLMAAAALAGWLTLVRLTRPRPVEAPTDAVPGNVDRRRFLTGIAGAGAAAAVAGFGGRWLTIRRSETVRTSIGIPSASSTLPPPAADASFSVPGLTPIVVPNADFYRIDTALVIPRPNADTWAVTINGMVDREVTFTLDDLLGRDLVEQYTTISCVSNQVGGTLVGNAKWTGVRLDELLDEAGVQDGADQIVGHSVDGWTAGFPTELAFDGRSAIVAVGMNDDMLPPVHGFPARLIIPGLYGYVSATKWLSEIELTTWGAFDAYWVPRGWSKEGPIKTQSRIDVPDGGETLAASGATIAGVAWAPTRGISKVEISVDGGEWMECELTSPLSSDAWVQWRRDVTVAAGNHEVSVRATDGTGATQTDIVTSPAPNGTTGWHTVRFVTA
jgi:DMSO/TMAO reductase YedYZ molybdopterin-dependent catalytic subunit